MKFAMSRSNYPTLKQPTRLKIGNKQRRLTIQATLVSIWSIVIQRLTNPSELRVWWTCDQQGKLWWSAYDPLTGRSINQVSEEQMRAWIEQLRLSN